MRSTLYAIGVMKRSNVRPSRQWTAAAPAGEFAAEVGRASDRSITAVAARHEGRVNAGPMDCDGHRTTQLLVCPSICEQYVDLLSCCVG